MSPPSAPSCRSRRPRIARALVLAALALGLLYAWDGSRQPASGSGWRLLIAQRGLGELSTVQVIDDQAELAAAWEKLRLIPAVPLIDFTREIVIWFVDTGTFGCRSRLDGVRFDPGSRLVTGIFGNGLVAFCDDASVPDSFLVTLDRNRLPPVPYRIQLREVPPPDSPGAIVEVAS